MSQYFCHTCNTRIERINDDYTCPSCSQGFIEELDQNEVGGGGPGNSPINPLDFLQLIGLASQGGAGFPLNTTGRRRNPANPNSGTTTATTDDDQQQQGGGATGGGHSPSESQSPSGRSSRGHRHHHHGPHFSFVLDTRAGGGGVPGAGGAAATGGSGGNAEIPVENMFLNFITDLLTGLGGGQQQLNFGGLGIPLSGNINLGDYAWGREGFDAIVTQLMNNMEGTGPAPLTTEKLSELNNISISQEQVDAKLQCSVCWEDFTIGENVIRLDCEHIYHPDCILPWLKLHGTCPVCRKDLNQPNDEMKNSTTIDDHHHVPTNSSSEEQQHRQQNNPNSTSNTLDEDMEFD